MSQFRVSSTPLLKIRIDIYCINKNTEKSYKFILNWNTQYISHVTHFYSSFVTTTGDQANVETFFNFEYMLYIMSSNLCRKIDDHLNQILLDLFKSPGYVNCNFLNKKMRLNDFGFCSHFT